MHHRFVAAAFAAALSISAHAQEAFNTYTGSITGAVDQLPSP